MTNPKPKQPTPPPADWTVPWRWISDKVVGLKELDGDIKTSNGKTIKFAMGNRSDQTFAPVLVMGTTDGTFQNTNVHVIGTEEAMHVRAIVDRFLLANEHGLSKVKDRGRGKPPLSAL